MSNIRERLSGIELLRIICMFGIIAYHYAVWGGFKSFSLYEFGHKMIFLQVLNLPGKICCVIFGLITGYFLVCYKTYDWTYFRKIVFVVAQMYFYYLIILGIFLFAKPIPVSAKDILKSLFPTVYGTWYAVNYVLIYLLAPFLNKLIFHLKKKNFIYLLLFVVLIWSLIPTFMMPTKVTTQVFDFGSLDFFIVTYLFGAYLRIHHKFAYKNKYNLYISIGLFVVLIFSVIVFDLIGVWSTNKKFIDNATYLRAGNSPISIAIAWFLLLYFANLKFTNKTINFISKSMFGVYLIHNNFILRRYIWNYLYPNSEYFSNIYLHSFIKILFVFIICILIDKFRIITVERMFTQYVMPAIDKKGQKLFYKYSNLS